jgi:hypothetical protein
MQIQNHTMIGAAAYFYLLTLDFFVEFFFRASAGGFVGTVRKRLAGGCTILSASKELWTTATEEFITVNVCWRFLEVEGNSQWFW